MRRSEARRCAALAFGCGLQGWLACAPSFEAGEAPANSGGSAATGAAAGSLAAGRAGNGGMRANAGAPPSEAQGGANAGDAPTGRGGSGPGAGDGGDGATAGSAAASGGSSGTGGGAGSGAGGDEAEGGAGGVTPEPPSYRDTILAAGPLVYWRMSIADGPVVPDEIGENDLILQGGGHALALAGAIASDDDGAIGFDGAASFAIATEPRALDFEAGAAFTLECWARHESGAAGYFQHLISNTEGSPGNRNGYILYLLPEADVGDSPRTSFELDRVGSEVGISGPAPEYSMWTHLAAVFDGSQIALYVAGTQRNTAAIDGAMTARSGPFAVARASNEDARYFKGALDEIAVYARALGIAEIAEHASFATRR